MLYNIVNKNLGTNLVEYYASTSVFTSYLTLSTDINTNFLVNNPADAAT